MTLDEFATTTRKVISRDGFSEFLPTACFPERQSVAVLSGIPDGVDVQAAAIDWATAKAAAGEDVLVAFKISPSQFKIVQRHGNEMEEKVFDAFAAESRSA